jgi:DNA polymerase-3 subunit alpha
MMSEYFGFVHLHCHTSHSLLDGLGNPDRWVDVAVKKGFKALAITDHGSCSGALDFYRNAKEKGLIPIVGVEFYCSDDPSFRPGKGEKNERYHLTVLAKTWAGLQSIFKQLSIANRQFYRKPLLSMDQIYDFKECVVMSACAGGILSHSNSGTIVPKLKEAYGEDFYLEVMPHILDKQVSVNRLAATMWKLLEIDPVATNDAHYPDAEDNLTQDVLLAVQTNSRMDDKKRFSFLAAKEGSEGLDGLYLKSHSEMIEAFKPWITGDSPIAGIFDVPFLHRAFKSTVGITEKCSGLEIPKLNFALPKIDPRLDKESEARLLMRLCMKGWELKIKGKVKDERAYVDRLRHELRVISVIGAVRYFLIVWDIVNHAKLEGILCGFGRGSVGGSLVAHLLGLTNVDPIVHGLYFERFLREDRIDMPDIDLDFAGNDRDRVIRYIKMKYGEENVSQISTITKMHGKLALRDVSRVYSVDVKRVNEAAKRVNNDLSLEENFASDVTLAAFAKDFSEVAKHASKLDGQIRTKGLHAGGVIISEDGFQDRGVLEKRKDSVAVNWSMEECEHFGLLKVDVLGLNNLSVLKDTAALVAENLGEKLNYHALKPDDQEVLRQFGEGHTLGFFQFESDGITNLCTRIAPIEDFETLIHINALYRPGPLDSGMVETYVNRRKLIEPVAYYHPKEESITAQSLGLPIFQEQIMAYFVYLAGFTWPEADTMRKIIAKSKGAEKLEEKRKVFVDGCKETSGIEEDVSNKIYDAVCKFGRYGFNKAHSACYSYIAYLTAYAKKNYPLEFMCALLRSVISEPEQTVRYAAEAERLGIRLLGPDVNLSGESFSIADGKIIAGFSSVKGVGEKAAAEIVEARIAGGKFRDFFDFLSRTPRRTVNKKIVEALAFAGAFDPLVAGNPKWVVDHYPIIAVGGTVGGIPSPDRHERFDEKKLASKRALFVPGIYSADDISVKAALEIHKDILQGLKEEIETCEACDFRKTCGSPVPFRFTRDSRIMVVSDFAGSDEDLKKEPLAGRVGQRFEELMREHCGLTPGKFLKAQVFNCTPPGRKLSKEDAEKCVCGKRHLSRLIIATKPEVILALGNVAMQFFTGKESGIMKLSGTAQWDPKHHAMVVFAVHPKSLMYDRGGENQELFAAALEKLREYL